MASAAKVLSHKGGGYEIQLTGDVCARIEPAVLQSCASAALACVEKNHLNQDTFAFTGECVSTLSQHIVKSDCVSQGFGLSPSVRVNAGQSSVSIHLSGEVSRHIDAHALEACVSAIAACADKNHPLDEKFSLNDRCLATLQKHDAETQCISKAFGLKSKR